MRIRRRRKLLVLEPKWLRQHLTLAGRSKVIGPKQSRSCRKHLVDILRLIGCKRARVYSFLLDPSVLRCALTTDNFRPIKLSVFHFLVILCVPYNVVVCTLKRRPQASSRCGRCWWPSVVPTTR